MTGPRLACRGGLYRGLDPMGGEGWGARSVLRHAPARPGALAAVLRVSRAGSFAAVMTALAGTAHAAAGGMAPGLGVTAVALLAVGAAAYAGTRREVGLLGVLVSTALCQGGLHLLFEMSMAVSCAPPTAGGGHGHMGGMGATLPVAGPVGAPAGGCAATTWTGLVTGHASGWMVLAHTAAALAAAWWLRRGERLAARLLSLLPALTAPLLGFVQVVAHRLGDELMTPVSQTAGTPRSCPDVRLAGSGSPTADPVSRRGPPRLTAA